MSDLLINLFKVEIMYICIGGYYDAGDYTKFGFPMAFSITMLAWGVIEYWDVYESIGELKIALEALKWGSDYFLKAHVSTYELYGQVMTIFSNVLFQKIIIT